VNSSISRQLILWLAIPLLLMALCGALVHYFNNVAPNVISSDRRLKDAAAALMAHVVMHEGQATLDLNPDRNPPLPRADSIRYAMHDSSGALLSGDAQLPAIAIDGQSSQVLALAQLDGRSVRTLSTRFGSPAGVITITVADLKARSEPEARLGFMSTLLWDFVQLDITLVLVWLGIQLGLRPIRRLRDEIASRSPLDLRPIVETTVPREVAPVVVTLNRLFGMLRTSAQSQQQFIADTAHQLRTPITGMQAQLDVLMTEQAAQPVKARLLTLQESIRQLAHSANQLLSLARADRATNLSAKNQLVDLQNIVNEVAAKFFDRALRSNIDLGVEAAPAAVRADPALLDDLLSNLVDNALKYTAAGGTVTVSAGEKNGRPFLAVEDSGVGIPIEERQRVRQRFYRMPNSPGHGSGLGLAIVDEIAKLYDATLTIESGTGEIGARMFIQFPARNLS
jgi:two-component system, OmpR family, sensor histidine kinase TctE